MITVLIVDGNPRLAHVLGQLLDDDHRFRLVGEVGCVIEALCAAKQQAPDVVLVSEQVDGVGGVALCAALRSAAPDAALLLWRSEPSSPPPPHVDGLLERGMTYRDLGRAVRDAHRRRVPARVLDLTEQAAPATRA